MSLNFDSWVTGTFVKGTDMWTWDQLTELFSLRFGNSITKEELSQTLRSNYDKEYLQESYNLQDIAAKLDWLLTNRPYKRYAAGYRMSGAHPLELSVSVAQVCQEVLKIADFDEDFKSSELYDLEKHLNENSDSLLYALRVLTGIVLISKRSSPEALMYIFDVYTLVLGIRVKPSSSFDSRKVGFSGYHSEFFKYAAGLGMAFWDELNYIKLGVSKLNSVWLREKDTDTYLGQTAYYYAANWDSRAFADEIYKQFRYGWYEVINDESLSEVCKLLYIIRKLKYRLKPTLDNPTDTQLKMVDDLINCVTISLITKEISGKLN